MTKTKLEELQEQIDDLSKSLTAKMAELNTKLKKDSVVTRLTSGMVILTSWIQGGRKGDFNDYADAVLKEYTDLSKDTIDKRTP